MWFMLHITVTESLNSPQCRTCPPLFSLTSCAPTAVGALVLPGLSSDGLVQWPQTHSQTHVMCQPSTAGPTGGGLPSLFAGGTPPVYTAPANAILVVGPCLWVLLRGCAYENRPGTHNPLFRWLCMFFKMS